ncbi:MAG: TRAP transporter substrate-binding protein [Betaproteobacteria bacterium]|nr:TRAP transporter substrate-binding protein [Betaproteobacteria bacterium]
MKRRTFLTQAGAGLATAAIAAPAIAQAAPEIKWRLASSFPKSLDTIYGAGAFFCERVSKLTSGKFEITPYAAGQIVKPLEVLDAVQQATVECGHTASYYYVNKNRAFAFGCAIPFGLTSRQQSAWEYAGGGMELLRDFYKEYGIIHFPAGNTGTQMGGWFKKEIKTLADLKGLKMRIPGIGGEVMGRLGAVPLSLPGNEIYAALERGVIDAAEWIGPYDDEKLGLYKIAKHYYYPAFWEGGTETCVMINAAAWDKLPKPYQDAVESAAAEAHVKMQAQYDAKNPVALKSMIANGVKLHPFPRDLLRAASKASFELYDAEAAKNPGFKKIYEPWKKFREQQYEWFAIAELSFESLAQPGK